MLLTFYQFINILLTPVIWVYLVYRKKNGKEDPLRFSERFGKAASPRPAGTLVWIHAASVGESLSVLPLVQKLCSAYSNAHILFTTVTVSSAKMIESKLPDNAFHQFVPIDNPLAVKRFLSHWQPDLALWVESELWPSLIYQTSQDCPILLVNARMSDQSYRYWKYFKGFASQILSRFTHVFGQSQHDTDRYRELGARQVTFTGNIKYDAPALSADPKKMGELVNTIGQRPVWLAASTHHDEETKIAEIHNHLKETHPDLLTIIVPRHPNRADDIIKDIGPSMEVIKRSSEEEITSSTDIYLADTMGELGIFYRLAPIVFIGGTLIPHGGQNPLEAARLDCAIIFGPYMDNFLEIKREFEQHNAAIKVKSKSELAQVVEELIVDHDKQEALAQAATKLVEEKSGILDTLCEHVHPLIRKVEPTSDTNLQTQETST